ncbi:unnamed protein product [Rotaria magnacalcarata]|uniref:Uncharacterized protein n=1 Tax=Rotaria magnacalcarata TaxID=392030 RepID=A0A8S2SDG0_9BILA|nr:unnamed protein product [Rotaria magnacalcarata]
MNSPSSRRSTSHTSSVSSGPSTPALRRRKPQQIECNISNCFKWANPNNNDNPNVSTNTNESSSQQQQRIQHDEASTNCDQSDNEMTPSTIMNSLSLSNSNGNNENNVDETTVSLNSAVSSDMEDNVNDLTNSDGNAMSNSQKKANELKQIELLSLFDACDGGSVYVCKLCKSSSMTISTIEYYRLNINSVSLANYDDIRCVGQISLPQGQSLTVYIILYAMDYAALDFGD